MATPFFSYSYEAAAGAGIFIQPLLRLYFAKALFTSRAFTKPSLLILRFSCLFTS
jgi:hypothetical protein